jgi:LemA protein
MNQKVSRWIIIIVVVLLIGGGSSAWIQTSNRLNAEQQVYQAQWSQVENQMQRRYDLIPNVVASVKGDMHQEQRVFDSIAKARSNYAKATNATDKMKADAQVNSSVGNLISVIHERYPQLNSDKRVHELILELEGSENRISVERQRYIRDVQAYNLSIMNFPSSIVAKAKGMKPQSYYQATKDAQKAPAVDLDN